jgi:hypothetical protein
MKRRPYRDYTLAALCHLLDHVEIRSTEYQVIKEELHHRWNKPEKDPEHPVLFTAEEWNRTRVRWGALHAT